MQRRPASEVEKLDRQSRDVTAQLVMNPMQFMQRLTALVLGRGYTLSDSMGCGREMRGPRPSASIA
jgi:hypothetical protein